MLADPQHERFKIRLPTIIERARRLIGSLEQCARPGIAQVEGLIFGYVLVVRAGEPGVLVREILGRSDECLNAWIIKQAIDVVIMAQKILRHDSVGGMLAELRADRLQLLHQRIAGLISGNIDSAIIDQTL